MLEDMQDVAGRRMKSETTSPTAAAEVLFQRSTTKPSKIKAPLLSELTAGFT